MSRLSKILMLLLSVLLLAQCEQNNWGDYYDRPSWLGPPLLQTLENAGNFTQYVSCVHRTGYALDRSGSYTLFAPNDEAFALYLQEKGLTSAEELSDEEASNLVAYSLVINPFSLDQLTTFQDATYGEERVAYKRTTMMYEGMKFGEMFFHTDNGTEYVNDDTRAYYNQNKYHTNSTPSLANGFDIDDKGYKYIPYFLQRLLNFTEDDYALFFGEGRYIGRNVVNAQIVTEEPVQAENGLVYELDRVIEPLPTLEGILAEDQELTDPKGYGKFRKLIETYSSAVSPTTLVEFINEPELTSSAQNAHPGLTVYVKLYSGSLAFPLNAENYTTTYGAKSGQRYGYTLLAPNNAAFDEFNAYLMERGGYTLDSATLKRTYNGVTVNIDLGPLKVAFINAHMTTNSFWPQQFAGNQNHLGDFVTGSESAGIDLSKVVDFRMASNGVLYGQNTYLRSANFESVYSELFLNPKYSLHKEAVTSYGTDIRDDALNSLLRDKSASEYLSLFLIPNELLIRDGFTWTQADGFSNGNMTASNARTRITRLVTTHAIKRNAYEALVGDPATTFAGLDPSEEGATYDWWSGYAVAQSYSGDLIRYKDGQLQGIGNLDDHTFVDLAIAYDPRVSSSDGASTNAFNGVAYEVQNYMIEYSPRNSVNDENGNYVASLDVTGRAWVDHSRIAIFPRLQTDVEPDFEAMENPDSVWYNPDVNYMMQWLNQAGVNSYNRVFMNNNDRVITVLLPKDDAVREAIEMGYLELPVDDNYDTDLIPLWLDTINWRTEQYGGVFENRTDSLFWLNQIRYFVSQHVLIGYEFYEDNTTPVVSNYIATPLEYRTSSSLEVRGARPAVRVRKNENNDLYYTTFYDEVQTMGAQPVTIRHESSVVADRSRGRNSYNMMGSKMVLHVIKSTPGSNSPGFLVYDKPAN